MLRFQSFFGVGLVILISTSGTAFGATQFPAKETAGLTGRTAKTTSLKLPGVEGSAKTDGAEEYFECSAPSHGKKSAGSRGKSGGSRGKMHAKSHKSGKHGKYSHNRRNHRPYRHYKGYGHNSLYGYGRHYRPEWYRGYSPYFQGGSYGDDCDEDEGYEESGPPISYREDCEPEYREEECDEDSFGEGEYYPLKSYREGYGGYNEYRHKDHRRKGYGHERHEHKGYGHKSGGQKGHGHEGHGSMGSKGHGSKGSKGRG